MKKKQTFSEENFELGEKDPVFEKASLDYPADDRMYNSIRKNLDNGQINHPARIQVTVQKGKVILEGYVETKNEKLLAETLIEGLVGVKRVENKLILMDGPISGPSEVTIKDLGVDV
jgi:osmotically-inducible protein OsmY